MTKRFLLIFFSVLFTGLLYAQYPMVVVNNNSTNLNLRVSASGSATSLDLISPGKKLVALSDNGNCADLWYQVYIPKNGTYTTLWVSHTQGIMNPVTSSQGTVSITGTNVNIRTTAGGSTNVKLNNVDLKTSSPQRFVVLGTQTVSGTTWYQVQLTNNCSQTTGWISNGSWLTYSSLAAAPTCSTLSGLTESLNNGIATMSWSAGSGCYYYRYRINSGNWIEYNHTSSTSFQQSLSPGNSIQWQVANECKGRHATLSSTRTFTVPSCTTPGMPGTPTPSNTTTVSFRANWTGMSGITYRLDVSTNASFSTFVNGYNNLNVGSVANHTVTGLNPNTVYYFRIRAVNNCGAVSSSSNYQSVTTLICNTCPAYDFELTPTQSWQNHPSSHLAGGCNIYRIPVSPGNTYTFKTGCGNNAAANYDTYFELYSSSCTLIASNNNGCSNLLSTISYSHTGSTNGIVYLKVRGNNNTGGTYNLAYNYVCTPPQAQITASNTNIYSGGSVQLSASACSGCNYTYNVYYNGQIVYSLLNSSSNTATVTFAYPGTYSVGLIVSNGCSQSSTNISGYINVQGYTNYSNNNPSPQQTQNPTICDPRYPKAVVADPVNLVTGQLEHSFEALRMAVRGGELAFILNYNGAPTHYNGNNVVNYVDGKVGSNWSHSFDYRIYKHGDTIWTVHYPDMHETPFVAVYNNGNIRTQSFPNVAGVFDSLKRDPVTRIFTLTLKNRHRLVFDSTGVLVSMFDRNNNQTQLAYNPQGQLVSVIGAGGRTFTITYNTSGLISQISAGSGYTVSFGYTGTDMTSFTDAEGRTYLYHYNANHQIDWIKKPKGNYLIQNEYTNGKITKQWDGKGNMTEFLYDTPSTRWVTVRFADLSTRIYKHDSLWRVIREKDEEGFWDSTSYGVNNIPTKHFDRNFHISRFSADNLGNITNIYMPLGRNTKTAYNNLSDITYTVDAGNDTTRFLRDANGNVIKTIFADGAFIRSRYNAYGQLVANIDAKGVRVDSFTYTPQGDIYQHFTVTGVYLYGTNAIGQKIAVTNPLNRTDSTIFNKVGEPIRHIRADGKAELFGYDRNGNDTLYKDFRGGIYMKLYDLNDLPSHIYGPKGYHEQTFHNPRNFKVKTINSVGDSVMITPDKRGITKEIRLNNHPAAINMLDNEGNVIGVQDPEGKNISNTLDSLYQLVQTNFNGVYTTSTEYNVKGLPKKVYNGNGDFLKYSYSRRNVPDSIFDEANQPIYLGRDANLNLTLIRDAEQHNNLKLYNQSDQDSVSTDADGKSVRTIYYADRTVHQITNPDNTTITSTYTANQQPETITYSGGQTYTRFYDANGNDTMNTGPLGVERFRYKDSVDHCVYQKDIWNQELTFEKDALNRPTKTNYPGGLQIQARYNEFNKPDTIYLNPTQFFLYEYDQIGQLKTKKYPNGVIFKVVRDNIHRPVRFIYYKPNGMVNDTLLDIWGHRTGAGDIDTFHVKGSAAFTPVLKPVSKVYTYKPNDVITGDGDFIFLSNPKGGTTDQKDLSGNTLLHFSFIQNDLLDTLASPAETIKMWWNSMEKLAGFTKNGHQTRLIQDNTQAVSRLMMTQNAQGVTTGTYVWDYMGPIAFRDSTGNWFYYHFDMFGHTAFLTNGLGQITDKYAYDIFGTLTRHAGNCPQLLRTLGQNGAIAINDSIVNIQTRFLQTTRNTFITKDRAPFDEKNPLSLHRLIHAYNNPVGYMDLNGWCAEKSTFENILEGMETVYDIITDDGKKFIGFHNGSLKLWKNGFYGNQYVNASDVKAFKAGTQLLGDVFKGVDIYSRVVDTKTHLAENRSKNQKGTVDYRINNVLIAADAVMPTNGFYDFKQKQDKLSEDYVNQKMTGFDFWTQTIENGAGVMIPGFDFIHDKVSKPLFNLIEKQSYNLALKLYK